MLINDMETASDYGVLRQKVADHDSAIRDLTAELRSSFSALNAKFDERFNMMAANSKMPLTTVMSMISVAVLIVSSLGFLALEPIKGRLASIELAMGNSVVGRLEYVEKWKSNDKELDNVRENVKLIRDQYNQVYNAKDIIRDMITRLDRLESQKSWSAKTERP